MARSRDGEVWSHLIRGGALGLRVGGERLVFVGGRAGYDEPNATVAARDRLPHVGGLLPGFKLVNGERSNQC